MKKITTLNLAVKKSLLPALLSLAVWLPTAQAAARDFIVLDKTLDSKVALYDTCDEHCPEVEYYFIDTGYRWLDTTINKAVIASLDLGDNADNRLAQKQWQAFLANQNPTDAQLAQQLDVALKSILAANNAFVKESKSELHYSVHAKPSYLGSKGDVQLFNLYSDQFQGGAHGVSNLEYFNFDMAAKKRLSLDDLLLPNQKPKLTQLAKSAFITYLKQADINPQEHLKTWSFFLTDNVSFTPTGLVLGYQPYELGPYAMGSVELTLPYSQLAGVLKPEYAKPYAQ